MRPLPALLLIPLGASAATTEFCLEGEFDLGARLQGTRPQAGEFYPATWCVATEDESNRVIFRAQGHVNPDMEDRGIFAYVPPDVVRIISLDPPPIDIEFRPSDIRDEAMRVRRLDPKRLAEEFRADPGAFRGVSVEFDNDLPSRLTTSADLPLRGTVDVEWRWDWSDPDHPVATLTVDGEVLLNATGSWEEYEPQQVEKLWTGSGRLDPVQVPGERWPSTINMRLISLSDSVHLVRGVRTGFQHLVAETDEGLFIGDAPSGWVELHQIPPADLNPGLGISGLSENFIDFLEEAFPDRPIAGVALTHFHDDHAGGARAFAAAGASVYANEASAAFLSHALNRDSMPPDRLTEAGDEVKITPVSEATRVGGENAFVEIVPIGAGPHAYAMLGVLANGYFFVSDIHVPRSDADRPVADRASTECWFANWAVNNLPADTEVVNSHSDVVTPVSRLAAYRDSAACHSQSR